MKVIVFDLVGKFAHFRKFYTNSSSLTYGVPPRTTIAGMLAAILGLERDSYYEIFSSEKLFVSVRKMTSTKKLLQTLNYMKATTATELITPKDHTQVPFEFLCGEPNLAFRIYMTYKDDGLLSDLENRIKENRPSYPLYLGSANFNCNIEYVNSLDGIQAKNQEFINLKTIIKSEEIQEINIANYMGRLVKERMPVEFSKDRIIKNITNYIYDDEGNSIEVKVKNEFITLSNGENIVFM